MRLVTQGILRFSHDPSAAMSESSSLDFHGTRARAPGSASPHAAGARTMQTVERWGPLLLVTLSPFVTRNAILLQILAPPHRLSTASLSKS
jgi:hypothetical protein